MRWTEQRAALEARCRLVPAPVATIEAGGGGSVRCMLAEIHLPRRAPAERARMHAARPGS
jgi:hypothetical protein